MSYSNIPAGKDVPNDIFVIIEIPANAAPIKYEVDKDSDALFVDRFMVGNFTCTVVWPKPSFFG